MDPRRSTLVEIPVGRLMVSMVVGKKPLHSSRIPEAGELGSRVQVWAEARTLALEEVDLGEPSRQAVQAESGPGAQARQKKHLSHCLQSELRRSERRCSSRKAKSLASRQIGGQGVEDQVVMVCNQIRPVFEVESTVFPLTTRAEVVEWPA